MILPPIRCRPPEPRAISAARGWLLSAAVAVVGAERRIHGAGFGPLAELAHQGTLQAKGVRLPPWCSRRTCGWLGRAGSWAAERIAAHLAAGATALDLEGSADPEGGRLTELRFAPGGKVVWMLAAPARITWRPAWRIERLRLAGPGTALALDPQ